MAVSQAVEQQLSKFWSKDSAKWSFANRILYDMCRENPGHDDADVIVGKLWLIGRSYAAAIERGAAGAKGADDFYYESVAPKLKEIGEELDSRIAGLNTSSCLLNQGLDAILNTHKFLMDAFSEITKKNNRSLASKYLHFHCPSMFYIYDSRASSAIRKIVKPNKDVLCKYEFSDYDAEYTHFCVRALELQEYMEKKCPKAVSPRELDNFLLGF